MASTSDIFSAAHELRAVRIREAVIASDIAYNEIRKILDAVVTSKEKVEVLAKVDTYLEAKINEIITRSCV